MTTSTMTDSSISREIQQSIKGTAVTPTIDFIIERHGEDVYQHIVSRLPQSNALRNRTIKRGDWIDLYDFIAFCHMAIEEIWMGDITKAHDLGYMSAKDSMPSLFKMFFKLGNVDYIIGKASLLFDNYYNTAILELQERSKKSSAITIRKLHDPSTIIVRRIVGYIEACIELSGGKNPHITWEQDSTDPLQWNIKVTWM
jgi:hypothetical protein